jgi:hypothetical protein
MDNIAEHYDHHRYESAAEHVEFSNSLLAHIENISAVAKRIKRDVHGQNPMQREFESDTQLLVSTLHPCEGIPAMDLHHIVSLCV